MLKFKMCSVESHTPDWIRSATVGLISNDRMTTLCKMDANLMLAAGFQPNFKERRFRIPLEYANVGYSKPAGARFPR